MAKDDMTTFLMIGGIAVGAYYILNNYGPNGAVYNASGQAVNPSYWQSWFGSTALAATTTPAPSTSIPATALAPAPPAYAPVPTAPSVYQGSGAPTTTPTPAPAPTAAATATIYSAMNSAAQSNTFIQTQQGQADAYQWATLWNAAGQPSITNVNQIFYPNGVTQGTPNGPGLSSQGLPLMSLSTFLSTLQSNNVPTATGANWGLGNIVELPSFGGGRGGFSGGFRGGFRKPFVN